MKIIFKMEDNKPFIVLSDNGQFLGFNQKDGHYSISRGYFRTLNDPQNKVELMLSWQLLQQYCHDVLKFN